LAETGRRGKREIVEYAAEEIVVIAALVEILTDFEYVL